MFELIKQMLIALLSFSRSIAAKCVSLNNKSCVARPTLVSLNPIEISFYPFMISLDRCNGRCNTVDDLPAKICVPNKTKYEKNVKVFNMITRINKAKKLVNIFHVIVNENLIVQNVIQTKSGMVISFNVSVKTIMGVKAWVYY